MGIGFLAHQKQEASQKDGGNNNLPRYEKSSKGILNVIKRAGVIKEAAEKSNLPFASVFFGGISMLFRSKYFENSLTFKVPTEEA